MPDPYRLSVSVHATLAYISPASESVRRPTLIGTMAGHLGRPRRALALTCFAIWGLSIVGGREETTCRFESSLSVEQVCSLSATGVHRPHKGPYGWIVNDKDDLGQLSLEGGEGGFSGTSSPHHGPARHGTMSCHPWRHERRDFDAARREKAHHDIRFCHATQNARKTATPSLSGLTLCSQFSPRFWQ